MPDSFESWLGTQTHRPDDVGVLARGLADGVLDVDHPEDPAVSSALDQARAEHREQASGAVEQPRPARRALCVGCGQAGDLGGLIVRTKAAGTVIESWYHHECLARARGRTAEGARFGMRRTIA